MTPPGRPISILIAALGGEGGSVLTNWIVTAAERLHLPVQSTSIPGVAQRTGATTYYIEIIPAPWHELGGRQPVLSLVPGIGDIDILLASELMEAGRAVAAGFVTANRTLTIASTARTYVMNEKIATGDALVDPERLIKAIEQHSQQHTLVDMEEIARRSGAVVSAVMLGALAGSGTRLPVSAQALEDAIRSDGKSVESNLRGFHAGLEAARQASATRSAAATAKAASDIINEGARRLAFYQNMAYAQLYIDRLAPIRLADENVRAEGRLLREVARHLAVRMSYEDVIRVAEAKIDPARFARIAAEIGAKPDDPVRITEFLKPGIEELCSILPPRLARRLLDLSARRGWLARAHWAMEVNSASVSGFLRFWALAKLRRWRPHSYRYGEEQREIEAWLRLVVDAAKVSGEFAIEVAACARLIKGYGDTHKRGMANYREIERRLIRPALAGHLGATGADAVASARTAALVDPDGESLARCFSEIEARAEQRLAAE